MQTVNNLPDNDPTPDQRFNTAPTQNNIMDLSYNCDLFNTPTMQNDVDQQSDLQSFMIVNDVEEGEANANNQTSDVFKMLSMSFYDRKHQSKSPIRET